MHATAQSGASPSVTYVRAQGASGTAPTVEAALRDQLIGRTYIKGKNYPTEIADGWHVSQSMLLLGKNKGDFFAMSKDGANVLVRARQEKKISAAKHEYMISDVLSIPAVQFDSVGASCSTRHSAVRSVYALLDMGSRKQIVWAAHVDPTTDKIAELPAGKSNKYLCRFRDGNKTVNHSFVW